MAKTAVFEGDPNTLSAKAFELKKELHRLAKVIADDDDVNLDTIDRANGLLSALKEFKLKKSASLDIPSSPEMVSGAVPDELKCPLSRELMRDPVVIASGQTFDRPFIQAWLKAGNRTCPRTQQVLSNAILMPNNLVRKMIEQWCKNHGINLPDSDDCHNGDGLTQADRNYFRHLLNKISTLSCQEEAAKELRLLTKTRPSIRALFGEIPNAIPRLLSPIERIKFTEDVQEDVITTLLNISIHESNKKLVAETNIVIPLLKEALTSGTIETRSNAAAALFTLSALDSNKALIGKSDTLRPLIDLLDQGHPSAMKDAASAIFNLCILHENLARAVQDGVVRVVLKNIRSSNHVDELLSILALVATSPQAIEDMVALDAVPCLFSVIRGTTCDRNKENCVVILYAICFNDRKKLQEMREEENTHQTLFRLVQNGTPRAKRKASGILQRINRSVNATHTT